jgi:perosamine synthetase
MSIATQEALDSAASPELDIWIAAIEHVLGAATRPVALHEPKFGQRERELVLDCIDTNWVSTGGKYVSLFEQQVAEFTGAKHAIAIVNGTAALHAALLLEGIGSGDEVLVPSITFVATANAVSHVGAMPHFCDSAWDTLGIDPVALDAHLASTAVVRDGRCVNTKTGRPIRAIVPVHIFGHPVDMRGLTLVASRYGLKVVEDATESLGSVYFGRQCGSFGYTAVLSFNGNKTITTGGGGMILTNDDEIAARARHLTTTGKRAHPWAFDHDIVAYNYRLPNINAALGCAQMERLPSMLAAKRELAKRYERAFDSIDGAHVFVEKEGSCSNYWLNTLVLDRKHAGRQALLLQKLHQRGIGCRPMWTPMHRLPMYRDCPKAPLPTAEDMFARCVSLPSSPFLAVG